MMARLSLFVYFLICTRLVFAQSKGDSVLVDSMVEEEMIKPVMLTTHPLGLFISRIDHHFTAAPPENIRLSFDIASGNVWLPPVTELIPLDPANAAFLSQIPWHKRDSVYQAMPKNHDSLYIGADGVIKTFRIRMDIRLTKQSELDVELRSFLLTKGEMPFTIFTSDAFIEAFHSRIAGGKDVFARKEYPYNQAYIDLYDKNKKAIHLREGDFIVPGLQLTYYYYPQIKSLWRHGIAINTGFHVGINSTAYNPGMDLGVSGMIRKTMKTGKTGFLYFAMAGSILRQKVLNWAR